MLLLLLCAWLVVFCVCGWEWKLKEGEGCETRWLSVYAVLSWLCTGREYEDNDYLYILLLTGFVWFWWVAVLWSVFVVLFVLMFWLFCPCLLFMGTGWLVVDAFIDWWCWELILLYFGWDWECWEVCWL